MSVHFDKINFHLRGPVFHVSFYMAAFYRLNQEDKPMTPASVPKFSQNHSTITNQID